MKSTRIILPFMVLILVGTLLFATGTRETPAGSDKPIIAVSILPQNYFVKRIGGDRVSTVVLVGSGQSPHSYEPTPKQMEQLSQAKAWILSNTDFEIGLAPKIASMYPSLQIVDGTEGVTFRLLEAHSHEGEENGVHEEHDNGLTNIDRHTWLGREPAKIMARHIKETLSAIDPAGAGFYEENYRVLINDIDTVFDGLVSTLAPLRGRTVFVYHPSFGYFFDDFGIIQEAVETGGKEPTAKSLAALIKEAQADEAAAIFVQAQFPVDAAKTVADAVGAQVVSLDPLAEDWLENIQRIGDTLQSSLNNE